MSNWFPTLFLWASVGFATLSFWQLSKKVESQLLELGEKANTTPYRMEVIGDNLYSLYPIPHRYEILGLMSNIVSLEMTNRGVLLVHAETREAMEDLVVALNSTFI